MPQQPTIRRAQPLDVVNLYRLVSEQGANDLFDLSDEAGALRFVLDAIVNGYALVAENKAGRLVGSIGYNTIMVGKTKACGCFWFVVSPPYRDGDTAADLLDLSLRAADYAGLAVHFARSLPLDGEVLKTLGFQETEGAWVLKVKKKNGASKKRKKEGQIPTAQ